MSGIDENPTLNRRSNHIKTKRNAVVSVLVALVLLTCPSFARAQTQQQNVVGTEAPGLSPNEQYEGYLFLDVDGQPLPYQSDEKIENFLANALVLASEKIPVGVTSPQKLTLAYGDIRANAAFKHIDRTERNVRTKVAGKQQNHREWRDWYGYDIAAYRVDRLLGLYRVPPTVARKIKRNRGSVTIWIRDTIPERERLKKAFEPPDIARFNQQQQTLRLFENLVANEDSNLGNTLIDGNWRFWFIDCSRCFGTSKDLLYAEAIRHCDREVLQALRDLDRDEAKEALSDFLSRYEINALFERRDKIIAHVEKLIAELGEEMVLFDSRPPTERAPWVTD